LSQTNNHGFCGADVGISYLKAGTKEQVYIIGEPEFGPVEEQLLLLDRAFSGFSSKLC
jgi:hypothetical protein